MLRRIFTLCLCICLPQLAIAQTESAPSLIPRSLNICHSFLKYDERIDAFFKEGWHIPADEETVQEAIAHFAFFGMIDRISPDNNIAVRWTSSYADSQATYESLLLDTDAPFIKAVIFRAETPLGSVFAFMREVRLQTGFTTITCGITGHELSSVWFITPFRASKMAQHRFSYVSVPMLRDEDFIQTASGIGIAFNFDLISEMLPDTPQFEAGFHTFTLLRSDR